MLTDSVRVREKEGGNDTTVLLPPRLLLLLLLWLSRFRAVRTIGASAWLGASRAMAAAAAIAAVRCADAIFLSYVTRQRSSKAATIFVTTSSKKRDVA